MSVYKFSWIILLIIALFVTVIVCIAIFLNKENIAMEIIKTIVIFGAGFAGGIYKGSRQTSSNKSDDDNHE